MFNTTIFKDYNILNVLKSIFKIYNTFYNFKNVDSRILIFLDVLIVMKMGIVNLVDMILNGWIKVKRRSILNN